jgi:acetolactate synthase-1/2/3 large subunit
VKYGQRFPYAGAMGGMGAGFPIAIGCAYATGKRVIYVGGDGCFQLNSQELEVVKRDKLNIKIFIINNGGYGSIMNTQRKYFDGRYVGSNEKSGLTLPPLEKIAKVYDMKYYRIENEKDVQSICKQALSGNDPCLVEVMEGDEYQVVMRVESKIVNGVPVSGKFEEV